MSSLTNFLKLFKWDTKTDGSQKFDIDKALNENWDKIDAGIENAQKTTITTEVSEEITVTDCAGVNAKLDIKNGKTVQNGTPTPETPIEIRNVGDNINIFINELQNKTLNGINVQINTDGSMTFNGTATANTFFYFTDDYKLNLLKGDYTASCNWNGSIVGTMYMNVNTGSESLTYFELLKQKNKTFSITENKLCRGYLYIYKDTVLKNLIVYPKLEQGSIATPYTPYNCGSADFKIKNKNFIDYNNRFIHSAITAQINNEELIITRKSSGASWLYFDVKGLEIGKIYTIKCNSQIIIYKDKIYGAAYSSSSNASNGHSFKAGQESYIVAIIIGSSDIPNVGDTLNCGKVQLEKGSISTDYIKHQEQIVSFPLAEGQVLHNGDYLASDGIHQKRKTIKLSELSWGLYTSISYENYIAFVSWPGAKNETNNINTLSNILPLIKNGWEKQSENMSRFTSGVYIRILKSRLETQDVAGFKSWLSNIEGMLEYELAEEIVIPYTEEQKEAYYQLQHLLMYETYTNITCVNEIKPDIQLTYYYNNLLNKSYAKRFDELEEKIRNLQIGG